MHWISKSLYDTKKFFSYKYKNIRIANVICNLLVRYCYNLYIYIYIYVKCLYVTFNILYYSHMDQSLSSAAKYLASSIILSCILWQLDTLPYFISDKL